MQGSGEVSSGSVAFPVPGKNATRGLPSPVRSLAAQTDEGLDFFDVTEADARQPLLSAADVSGVTPCGSGKPWWMAPQARYLYVGTPGGGLRIFDASGPRAPREVNHLAAGELRGIPPPSVFGVGSLSVLTRGAA